MAAPLWLANGHSVNDLFPDFPPRAFHIGMLVLAISAAAPIATWFSASNAAGPRTRRAIRVAGLTFPLMPTLLIAGDMPPDVAMPASAWFDTVAGVWAVCRGEFRIGISELGTGLIPSVFAWAIFWGLTEALIRFKGPVVE